MNDALEHGQVTHTNDVDRGYAFITPDDAASRRIFLHKHSYSGNWPPAIGQRVSFRSVPPHDGHACRRALDCKPLP